MACRTDHGISSSRELPIQSRDILFQAFSQSFDNSQDNGFGVYSDPNGLVLIDMKAKQRHPLIYGSINWCAVDNRTKSLWFLLEKKIKESKERKHYALYIINYNNAAQAIPVVSLRASFQPDVKIDYRQFGSLGESASFVSAEHGIRLIMDPEIKLAPFIECRGDAESYCYEESAEGRRRLTVVAAKEKEELASASLLSINVLKQVQRSGQSRNVWLYENPNRTNLRVDVNLPSCRDEACGEGIGLDGTKYYSVVVGIERGDFLHHYRQLYDAEKGNFVDFLNTSITSKAPIPNALPLSEMFVSKSGNNVMMKNYIATFREGILAKDAVAICGWLGGTYHVRDEHPW